MTMTLERTSGEAPPALPARARTLRLPSARAVVAAMVLGLLGAASLWSLISLDFGLASMLRSIDNAANFLARTLPLDFPPLGELVEMTLLTLALVVSATVLSVVLSTIIALAAARPTSRSAPVRGAARGVIVLMRAMPELVLAIIFIRLFGLGSVAGILAMGLHSIGMIGRMYADAIEDADDGPRQALESAGASRIQQIFGAVLPGVLPAMVATGLHRFDINLRVSVILGWVGVGGIGMELSHALSTTNYSRGIALALVVLALCIITEMISGAIRVRLLGQGPVRRRWFSRSPRDLGTRTTPQWGPDRVARMGYLVLTAAVIGASLWRSDVDWARFFAGFANFGHTAGLFLPPDDGGILDRLLAELWVTIQIALAATFLGALLALPVGFLAARNVAPNTKVARFFRVVIVVVRGIPELILAIVLVVITGMGPVAGALALGIGAMGLLSKLVADSIEETDVRVQQAVAAGGATRSQVFVAATLRQSAPAIVGHVLYQLDVNFRSATLLGIVGAGGIGFYLLNATRVLQFEVVTLILLMIIALVLVLEALAVLLRRIMR